MNECAINQIFNYYCLDNAFAWKNCGGYVQVSVDQQEFISEFSLICHQFIRHNSQYQYYNVQVPMNVQLICHTR